MNNINDFEKLKKEIWYLNKVRIPSLEQMIEEELGKKATEICYARQGSQILFGEVR